MTSDEVLICQGAKALIQANNQINLTDVQTALIGDEAGITLPALVISADLKDEESGTSLGRKYELKTELRWLTRLPPTAGEDDIMDRIADTLCPFGETSMVTPPSVITVNFDFYRIEKQNGADFAQGQIDDLNTRSRSFDVFAGRVSRAPRWMQRSGLEWSYRLAQEPRRMGKRYLVGNTRFLSLIPTSDDVSITVCISCVRFSRIRLATALLLMRSSHTGTSPPEIRGTSRCENMPASNAESCMRI